MSPYNSDNLSKVIEAEGNEFVVLRSPETAAYDPEYREIGRFSTRARAEAFLATA